MSRVQRQLRRVFVVQAALCALLVILSYLLLMRYGITGIGIAWLTGQSVIALSLVLYEALCDGQYFRPLDGSAVAKNRFIVPDFIGPDPILQLSRPLRDAWSRGRSIYRWMRMKPTINRIVHQVQNESSDSVWQVQ